MIELFHSRIIWTLQKAQLLIIQSSIESLSGLYGPPLSKIVKTWSNLDKHCHWSWKMQWMICTEITFLYFVTGLSIFIQNNSAVNYSPHPNEHIHFVRIIAHSSFVSVINTNSAWHPYMLADYHVMETLETLLVRTIYHFSGNVHGFRSAPESARADRTKEC